MEAVTIYDKVEARGGGRLLAIDLRDIIGLAEDKASASTWTCRGVEAIGSGAAELHKASETGGMLAGVDLRALALQLDQTIEGEFQAHLPGSKAPWLIVRAIDSTGFAVITEDLQLLERVRKTFRDVRDSPGDVYDVT